MGNKNGGEKAVSKPCKWLAKKNKNKIDSVCAKTDSHSGYGPAKDVCKVTCGTCPTAAPTRSPTENPTGSLTEPVTASPTKVATKAPTKLPTPATSQPTSAPVGQVCCSQFFNVCKDNPWCQESEENCTTCNGVFLPNLPLQCIPRFGMCGGNEDGCCYPSTCVATDGGGQCMYYPE